MSESETLDQFIKAQLESGSFDNYEALVEHALKLMQEREESLRSLQSDILPALDRLDNGEGENLDIESIISESESEFYSKNGSS